MGTLRPQTPGEGSSVYPFEPESLELKLSPRVQEAVVVVRVVERLDGDRPTSGPCFGATVGPVCIRLGWRARRRGLSSWTRIVPPCIYLNRRRG